MTLLNLLVIGLLISSADSSNEGNCAYVRIKEQPQQFAVQIKASPDVVKLGLTKTASLRCSGAPDSGDVQSITISRRGSKIATVTTTLAAYIMDAATDVQTTGQVAEAPPGQSFLELTWQLPSKPQLQNLACQITALDSEGQEVSAIKGFSFAFSRPTVMDGVKYVQQLEIEKDVEIQKQQNITDKLIATNAEMIVALQRENSSQSMKLQSLNEKLDSITMENVRQQQFITNLTQKITCLNKDLTPRVGFTMTFQSSGSTIHIANGQVAKYDKVIQNTDGAFDVDTGTFTCRVEGMYSFHIYVLESDNGTGDACLGLQLNGVTITTACHNSNSAETGAVLDLVQGDVVKVVALGNSYLDQPASGQGYQTNVFTGQLVYLNKYTTSCVGFTMTFRSSGNPNLPNGQVAKYDKVIQNTDGAFDVDTGTFTCRVAGMYSFHIYVMGTNQEACLGLQLNGGTITNAMAKKPNWNSASTGVVIDLVQGDVVRVVSCHHSYLYLRPDSGWGYQTNIFTGKLAYLNKCTTTRVGFTMTFNQSNGSTIHIANGQVAKYDKVIQNADGAFDVNTGAFQCQQPGMYSFHIYLLAYANKDACLSLQLNGGTITNAMAKNEDYNTASTGAVIDLVQGDVVRVVACCDSYFYKVPNNNNANGWGYQANIFTGQLA